MTVKAVTITDISTQDRSCLLFTWASMANGDSGEPLKMVEWADRCIQFVGTPGAGGTFVFEGSNDKTNWFTLDNPQGTGLSFTAAGLKQVLEVPLWCRPNVTAGDGTTAIVATLVVRRPNPGRT